VLDALKRAIHARCPSGAGNLVHHSDRGSQYVAIRYTERLAEAGIEPSVGSVGNSYDYALAETINSFMPLWTTSPWLRNLCKLVCANLGAVQFGY